MAKGGKQPGAGRPKGSKTRPQLRDFYTLKELEAFVISLKERAETDSVIAKFVAEQIFGKAVQPLGGDPENPLVLQITGMKIVKEPKEK